MQKKKNKQDHKNSPIIKSGTNDRPGNASVKTRLEVRNEVFPTAGVFSISRGSRTEVAVVVVTLNQGIHSGRGECVPYSRYSETVNGVVANIEKNRSVIEAGSLDRQSLQQILAAGAARNAIDCALWDLEAKKSGISVMNRLGVHAVSRGSSPLTLRTASTVSLGTPESMAEAARREKDQGRRLLKVKLGGNVEDEIHRIRAVRSSVGGEVELIADANEGWPEEKVPLFLQACAEAQFTMVEQPLPAAADESLRGIARPPALLLGADESVHDRTSLRKLVGLYDVVNIKLDKTGGLTEALLMAEEARDLGFQIMVGCMVGTSLGMAPAAILAAACEARFVDLDGPLLLARDRESGLVYEGSQVQLPQRKLWG